MITAPNRSTITAPTSCYPTGRHLTGPTITGRYPHRSHPTGRHLTGPTITGRYPHRSMI